MKYSGIYSYFFFLILFFLISSTSFAYKKEDVQTLLTQLMSYFRVITNPTPVFVTADKMADGKIIDEDVKSRLNQMVDKTLELAKRN